MALLSMPDIGIFNGKISIFFVVFYVFHTVAREEGSCELLELFNGVWKEFHSRARKEQPIKGTHRFFFFF